MGLAIAYSDGYWNWLVAFACLLAALFIQIGTNFANDYYDYLKGADNKNRLGPVRLTQSGLITPIAMKKAFYLMFILAAIIGLYLVQLGGLPILIIGILSICFGILYTGGKFPLGYLGWGDVLVLIFFGPVAVGGTYYLQSMSMSWDAVLIGFSPGFWSVAILTVNNLRDIQTDQKVGKYTLAVRFGKNFARKEYLFSVVMALLIPVLIIFKNSGPWLSILSLLSIFLAIPLCKQIFIKEKSSLNEVLAMTGKLLLVHSLFFSIGWIW